jgi:drug/metabolite transporter (DMT)-like permease
MYLMYALLSVANMPDKRIPVIDQPIWNGHQHSMKAPATSALIALIFTVIVWGITPVFARSVSLAMGPVEALIVRLILVAIVFAVLLSVTTGFHIDKKDWPRLLLISFVGMLGYFVSSVFGFRYAPAGVGTLIMSTQPMLIAILASVAGFEKLSSTTILGLIVSFVGSILLVWGSGEGVSAAMGAEIIFGCTLIFLGGVAWSVFVVFSKPLIQSYGALKISGLSNALIALPMLPFVNGRTVEAVSNLDQNGILELVFLTFIGVSASIITWNYAAATLRPSVLGASLYVMPLVAVIAGWAILNEAITTNTIIAAAIILAGVAISQVKLKVRTAT